MTLFLGLLLMAAFLAQVLWTVSASSIWEVRSTASNNNGGAFAVGGNTYSITNLSGTGCRSATPAVTSASYTFVNGDNTHYLWITGGQFVTGWYKILSQSGGTATLSPPNCTGTTVNGSLTVTAVSSFTGFSVGMAINGSGITAGTTIAALDPRHSTLQLSAAATASASGVTITQNVGTVDSPAATGSATIDRTMNDTAFTNGTNLTVDHTTNTKVNPDGYTVTTADVGNFVHITTTGTGAAFTVGWYQITAVTTGGSQRWTLDRSPAAIDSTGATWFMGGALATINQLGTNMAANQSAFIKTSGGYSTTSSISFTGNSGNPPTATTPPARLIGYTTDRGDHGQVVLTLSTTSSLTGISVPQGWYVENIIVDCAGLTTSTALANGTDTIFRNCVARKFTTQGFSLGGSPTRLFSCAAYDGTSAATQAYQINSGNAFFFNCVSRDNICPGFRVTSSPLATFVCCIAANNSGASSDGYVISTNSIRIDVIDCIAFNSGRHGIASGGTSVGWAINVKGCILHSNGQSSGTGYGLVLGSATGLAAMPGSDGNAYYNNATGTRNFGDDIGGTTLINAFRPYADIYDIVLTADPFVKVSTPVADLVVDGANNLKVTAASHVFVSGDVGETIFISSSTGGWTRGEYTISSVVSGAAILSSSPAATGTTGGSWYFDDFRINNTAGGGAALRGTDPIYTVPEYTGLNVGYADIGVFQHLDASQFQVYTPGGYTVRASNVTAATASSLTLDSGATSTTDIYKGLRVTIVAGTGVGQSRLITTNTNASPPVCTVVPNWTTTPDTTSVYALEPQAGVDIEQYGATTVTGSGVFKKNTAYTAFQFVMISASDHVSPLAGLGTGVTIERSIDGGAFAAATNSAAEVGNGLYKINLSAADLNGDGITFKFTGSGADPLLLTIYTT